MGRGRGLPNMVTASSFGLFQHIPSPRSACGRKLIHASATGRTSHHSHEASWMEAQMWCWRGEEVPANPLQLDKNKEAPSDMKSWLKPCTQSAIARLDKS